MKRAIVDYDADAVAARMASIVARPTDFGASCRRSADATDAQKADAIKAWKAWWKKQAEK